MGPKVVSSPQSPVPSLTSPGPVSGLGSPVSSPESHVPWASLGSPVFQSSVPHDWRLMTGDWGLLSGPSFQKSPQFPASGRVAQLPERLGLDLTDPLARHGEALTHLFERVLAPVADAEAHLDHLLLARRKSFQHRLGLLLQIEIDDRFGRRHDLPILDEVAEMRVLLFADRRLERNRLLRDLQHLA